VTPFDAPLGAEVTGVSLANDRSEGTLRTILDALYGNGMIAIRDQHDLKPADFSWLAHQVGRPQPHILEHLRLSEFPEILPLSNIFKDGEAIGIYDGAAFWHTDVAYEAEPSNATLVHAIQVPEVGGDTLFTNMRKAYDDLPADFRAQLDGLTVIHHYGNRSDQDQNSRTSVAPLKGDDQHRKAVDVHQPLVRVHPVTGRKALYAVAGSAIGIVGMATDAAEALLDELIEHATQARYVYAHKYRVGDVVIWDNFATMHAATLIDPATGPADTRYMHRISVKGGPALLADAGPATPASAA
jgi:taurine dioxygenase